MTAERHNRSPEPDRLRVIPLDSDDASWDAAVRRADESTFCHLAGWREIMNGVLGHECLYSVAVDPEGRWQAVLPLVHVKAAVLGDYLVSMPFLNYGGPIGSLAGQQALVTHAVTEAERLRVDLLEFRSRHSVPSNLKVNHRKITVLLDLPSSPEVLWREVFPSNLRTRIRRPQKEGMEARFGPDQLLPFYEVFRVNMRDLGTPVLPLRFFERVAEVFHGCTTFGAVYWRGQPLAGGCGFTWGGEFELTWVSALRKYKKMAPNNLLYWEFITHMIESGVRTFNFGRCSPGSGTHRFKRQWGGKDAPLPWLQWSSRNVEATPTPDRPLYAIAVNVWRRLPLTIANRAGPLLARYLP